MRITDIKIEHFGVWQNLHLPTQHQGITVVQGPNEAGKSTLLRFIRGILYGIPAQGSVPRNGTASRSGWGGSLQLRRGGELYHVSRRVDPQGQTHFRCQQDTRNLSEQQFEEQLLRVDADVFHSIFTLGLKELRELATLQTDQVSEYIHGTSLGTVGLRLLAAERQGREHVRLLGDPQHRTGKLLDLSGQYDSTRDALINADQVMNRYRQGLRECERLEEHRRQVQKQQELHQRERRGLQFLQRIWHPWKRQRELQQELSLYHEMAHFPADGLRQLESLERKLAGIQQTRNARKAETRQLKHRLQADRAKYELRDHASGIRALIQMKGLVETAERHLAAVSADASMLKAELDEKLKGLGPDWTIHKLDAVDTSPNAHLQLVMSAKNYQSALVRRARHRRTYRKVSDANHIRQTELQESLKKRNISVLELAIKQAQQRLRDLEQLVQLRIQESEYEQRIRSANTLLRKYREGAELPWWASFMLTIFAMGGGFLIVAGLLKGVQTSWLIGAIYMFTGIMAAGLSWSLRQHYETDDHKVHSRLEAELSECQQQLKHVREQIARITGIPFNARAVYRDPASQRAAHPEVELSREAQRKLAELEALARTQERILKTRKKLSIQRGKLSTFQREVSMARQNWCELLRKIGLRESVRTSEAFQNWQLAVDCAQTLMKWNAAREDMQRQSEMLAMFREQMDQIAGTLKLNGRPEHSLTQVLSEWQRALEEYERVRISYLKHRTQYNELRKQLEHSRTELEHTRGELADLLRRGNAHSPEEFRRNAQKLQRAGEVRALLADVADQLNSLVREEPELAIVEADLLHFNPAETQERLDLLGMEIEDLERSLARCHEELGRTRQNLDLLESDTTRADLQTRQQRLLDASRHTLQDWLAGTCAVKTLTHMTRQFEQKFQPETLARASHYLMQLTCGRYEQVRTPFGSRELIVHEASGGKRTIAELSDGTREQLFLAIRLALVDILAEEQIELPMVLDDICVNFDQERTEAAVDTILEFARRRQVLFFTCHRHLAALFEARGITPTRLPGPTGTERVREEVTLASNRPVPAFARALEQNPLDEEFDAGVLDACDETLEADPGDLRYFLRLDSPIVDAPSIGPKTADRFHHIHIHHVHEFLASDPRKLAQRLDTRWITPELVRDWQQQARLMCTVPALRCHDVQILQGVGVQDDQDLAQADPEDLLSLVNEFLTTNEGQRAVRGGKRPDLAEVAFWINNARLATQNQAA